jgi:TnpA family transposase
MRMLQHGGNPTQLGIALAHFGRIFKTLHVLSYVDAEPYRRDIKRMSAAGAAAGSRHAPRTGRGARAAAPARR